jgi:hypothetical protein
MPRMTPLFAAILFIVPLMVAAASPARGQDQPPPAVPPAEANPLQAENDALKEQLALALARARTSDNELRLLRDEAARLRDAMGAIVARLDALTGATAAPTDPAAKPVKPAQPDRSDPYASPGSMLAELQERFARDLSDMPTNTDSQRRTFEADARQWASRLMRQMKSKVSWVIKLEPVTLPGGASHGQAVMTVLNAITRQPVGEAFRVDVPERYIANLIRAQPAALYEFTGQFAPEITINPRRATPGVFNFPPLIGKYVEFGFKLDWLSLEPIRGTGDNRPPRDERSR